MPMFRRSLYVGTMTLNFVIAPATDAHPRARSAPGANDCDAIIVNSDARGSPSPFFPLNARHSVSHDDGLELRVSARVPRRRARRGHGYTPSHAGDYPTPPGARRASLPRVVAPRARD